MSQYKWVGDHIEIDPPKRPKKITGTRLGAILGVNKWNTPFKTWCDITKTYVEPFEDTKYTIAGKVIEPKQAEYMRTTYAMTRLKTPTDLFGPDYFNRTRGDFFPDEPHFGGMWDYLVYDENGKPETVLEMKTTSRPEDWKKGIPEYYAIQAALYAYLLDVNNVVMVCSFLAPEDYDHPEDFVPSVENTIAVPFKVSQRYPTFGTILEIAKKWWRDYVETGVSPAYSEKADKEILDILRTNSLHPDTDITKLITEAEALKDELDAHAAQVAKKEKRLKKVQEMIKEYAQGQFRDGDLKVELPGTRYDWTLTRSVSITADKQKLIEDGLWEKYQTASETYRLTSKAKKGE